MSESEGREEIMVSVSSGKLEIRQKREWEIEGMREKMRRMPRAWVGFGKVGDEEVGEDVWEIGRGKGSVERVINRVWTEGKGDWEERDGRTIGMGRI